MTAPMVLLPVFVLVGLTFFLLFMTASARTRSLTSGEVKFKDIALGKNWPDRAAQIGNSFNNQFQLPVLFYVLVAIALPLRHADLVFVLLSWVFVVTRFAHAGVFITSNNVKRRFYAWFAGVLVLLAMWLYFAIRILF
ncbi:MAG: hypothetical protein BGP05_19405 [Rhizobiales bacterium 62-47]|nr:MAPEG family protein [Hyphomicrobiales bacterium]OJY09927.1 MAG: hypothetical protein BGP05_19405 [Rhizobiales bacterium 62-47]